MPAAETPMGLALIVCDTILEDRLTGKKTLVGLFDRVQTAKLPCVHPEMCVFVSLTGGRGEYPCEIVCRHVDGETIAFSAKGKVVMRDPYQVVDLVFRLKGARFPKEDKYWLHFLVEGIPIMMRQMLVQRQAPKSAPEAPKPGQE